MIMMKIFEVTRLHLGQHKNDSARALINDFEEQTQENPLNPRQRIYDNTKIELYVSGRNVRISDIQTMKPRSGAATQAIKFLQQLADKHGVKLELTAKAYVHDKTYITDTTDLVRWYYKLGFELDDELVDDIEDLEGVEEVNMIYYPK